MLDISDVAGSTSSADMRLDFNIIYAAGFDGLRRMPFLHTRWPQAYTSGARGTRDRRRPRSGFSVRSPARPGEYICAAMHAAQEPIGARSTTPPPARPAP